MAAPLISIRVDDAEVRRRLWGLQKQVPFALAKAINTVVDKAYANTTSTAGQDMILRQDPKRNIQSRHATKSKPVGAVGSFREVLRLMVEGGEREDGAHRAAYPTDEIRGGDRRKRLTQRFWPSRLTDSAKTRAFFVHPGKGGYVIFKRFASGAYSPGDRKAARFRGLKALYRTGSAIRIKGGTWHLEKRVNQSVKMHWNNAVLEAVEYAIKTAK